MKVSHTKSELFLRLDVLCPQLLDLLGKDSLGSSSAVDTIGLDGDNNTTANLQEHVGVEGNNTGLIRLSNIGEDAVDHGDQHSVSEGVSGVFDNRNNVGSALSHVDKITSTSVRELDGLRDARLVPYQVSREDCKLT